MHRRVVYKAPKGGGTLVFDLRPHKGVMYEVDPFSMHLGPNSTLIFNLRRHFQAETKGWFYTTQDPHGITPGSIYHDGATKVIEDQTWEEEQKRIREALLEEAEKAVNKAMKKLGPGASRDDIEDLAYEILREEQCRRT